jgi:hypothetical protein
MVLWLRNHLDVGSWQVREEVLLAADWWLANN